MHEVLEFFILFFTEVQFLLISQVFDSYLGISEIAVKWSGMQNDHDKF